MTWSYVKFRDERQKKGLEIRGLFLEGSTEGGWTGEQLPLSSVGC
jgi:hypothetical protein